MLEYKVERSGDSYALFWENADGYAEKIFTLNHEALLKDLARALNSHTRGNEIFLSDRDEKPIRTVMAEQGLTFFDAVQYIFAKGINAVSGAGSLGFNYSVELVDRFPGSTVWLHFQDMDCGADENVEVMIKDENGELLYEDAQPLNTILRSGLPNGWQEHAEARAQELQTDYAVHVDLQNPEDGIFELLGEVGRKYGGVDSQAGNSCTWIFDTESEARSYMEEAAPIAARLSDGFEMNYTSETDL